MLDIDITYDVSQPVLEWIEDSYYPLSNSNEQFFFNSQNTSENSLNSISSQDLQYSEIFYKKNLIRILEGSNSSNRYFESWEQSDIISGKSSQKKLFDGKNKDITRNNDNKAFIKDSVGRNYLIGNFGHDLLAGSKNDDFIFGGQGNDTLKGSDFLISSKDKVYLNGKANRDRLHGGLGKDILVDYDGGDRLTGGANSDEFWVGSLFSEQTSIVTDFQPGIDRLKILRFDANWSKITLEDKKDGVIIFDRGKSVARLSGVKASDLSEESFIFFDELEMSNQNSNERQTIVISTPSANIRYYSDVYEDVVAFNIDYAKSIMDKDNVVVLGDRQTLRLLGKELPQDILLEANMRDIWMRDFTTINPNEPIQFRYTAAGQGGNQRDADWVQDGFVKFTDKLGIEYAYTDLKLDGGNVVDNHQDKAIVTKRFLKDNNLTKADAKIQLKNLLGVTEVAIIPSDDPKGLAHADGMVMFIDDNTIALNKYDEPFRSKVIGELKSAFPNIEIIEIDVEFDEEIWDKKFSSACGININSLVTNDFIYMPVFNAPLDNQAIKKIQANTTKQVVPINAENVCFMGGSVRCLGWQISGEPAQRIIEAARLF